MATWPGSLPQSPNVDSFSDIPQSTVIRSAMGGLTKQRTRFTAAVHDVSESYVINRTQADTFIAFFRDDLDNAGWSLTNRTPLRRDVCLPVRRAL